MTITQPTLDVGAGWSGATSEPGVVGSGPGSDAKAIALWDCVQWQTFGADLKVGISAFHVNGIDRVEFNCDNGTWVSSSGMTRNSQTGGWEFWATLPIAACTSDGLREVRAIAYPVVGLPRLLPSLFLFSNRSATLPQTNLYVATTGNDVTGDGSSGLPYLTLLKALQVASAAPVTFNGCTINIKDAGSFVLGTLSSQWNNTRWVSIVGAVPAIKIIGVAGGDIRPKVKYLRFSNVTFDFTLAPSVYPEADNEYWFDAVAFTDSGTWTHSMPSYPVVGNVPVAIYATDSTANDMEYGFCGMTLVRNCAMTKISSDALSNSLHVVNCTVDNIAEGIIVGTHADVCQHFGVFDQMIVYGVKATNVQELQGLFHDKTGSSFTNIAIVNYLVDAVQADPASPLSQLCSAHVHAVFAHVTIIGQNTDFRDDFTAGEQFTAANVLFENCVFNLLSRAAGAGLPAGVTALHSHFISGTQHGTAPSTGAVTIVDGAGLAFTYAGAGAAALLVSGVTMPGMNNSPPNRGAYAPLVESVIKGPTITAGVGLARANETRFL